jgi:hypothetical protein
MDKTWCSLRSDRGVSEEAKVIHALLTGVEDDLLNSMSLGAAYREALFSLRRMMAESSLTNWDGYGARAINPVALAHAVRLLKTLPTTAPIPELGLDPDGEIAFEWHLGPRRVFSLSVGSNGQLSYAGLFGRSDTHGTEYFGDELPKAILDNLNRLFSH